jgi:hypothetical protein
VSFNSFPLKCVDSGSTPLPNTVWASTFFICNMRLCERLLHVTVSVSGSVLFSPFPWQFCTLWKSTLRLQRLDTVSLT